MKVKDLIRRLLDCDLGAEVVIPYEGFTQVTTTRQCLLTEIEDKAMIVRGFRSEHDMRNGRRVRCVILDFLGGAK